VLTAQDGEELRRLDEAAVTLRDQFNVGSVAEKWRECGGVA
jgi:hypothetical protein